jgi:hypothetical protein
MWAALGGALLGGLMGKESSRQAANTQADTAREAAALQKQMFEKNIELQEPFRQGGLAAQNKLLQYLGLQTGAAPKVRTQAELRNSLASQYMRSGTGPESGGYYEDVREGNGDSDSIVKRWVPRAADTVDESGLNAAIQAAMAEDQAAQQAYQAQRNSPDFGKYTRDFGMQDFQQDPGYAFRMSEGLKALDRQAAARGGLISGAALKASQRYGQDMASEEYMNAFNRYQTNRTNQLNPLLSLSDKGQLSVNTIGTAGQNYANQAGEAYMGAGNARASGYLGQANALTGALNQGINAYGYNQRMRPGGGGMPGTDAFGFYQGPSQFGWAGQSSE